MANISKLSEKQDIELVELLKNGSQQAFIELYTRYQNKLLYCCKRYLNNEADAEDIVQDIFTQLWETRESLNVTSSFWGYIYTSAYHSILKVFRQFDVQSRYAQDILINAKELTNETEDLIMDNDYTALLNEITESLSPKQKDVIHLSRSQGLSYKEISEVLQISLSTVQTHAFLALKKIRELLKKHTGIDFKTFMILWVLFN